MKFSLSRRWIQNTFLLIIVVAALVVTYKERSLIESHATPELFFFAITSVVVLLCVNLLFSVTIRKRAEALAGVRTSDLLETQKLFVELYRNSPVPYVMVDHKGRVTYPNHAALHLFGLQEDTFEGRNIFDMFEVIGDEDNLKESIIFSRFSHGVFVEGRDVLIKREDGTSRYGLLSIFPYGSFGSQKKGLMTIVDITKQKEIEQAKTEFVSIASHQLRTPVSSMKWNLELMNSPQLGELSGEQLTYFTKIVRSLEKMNMLIDDFLNVSQLELGTKKVTIDTLELLPFFESICSEFDGKIAEKQLTLKRQFDERIRSIETDQSLLHMAVSNLVSNATKYTPEGGTVLVQYVAGNESLTISVIDTGVGIPAADSEKLFTKFFRAENVRANVTEGTGLGLYIVKLAIESLGGTISVQSKEGEGTTFDIVLPRAVSGRMLE